MVFLCGFLGYVILFFIFIYFVVVDVDVVCPFVIEYNKVQGEGLLYGGAPIHKEKKKESIKKK